MMDQDELITVFVEESIQHLESIEPDLLAMEKNIGIIDPQIINGIFRAVHSIKGASGFFGLQNIGNLAHIMENLLSMLRDGEINADSQLIDALLSGIDALRTMFDDIGSSENVNIQTEIERLTTLLNPAQDLDIDIEEQKEINNSVDKAADNSSEKISIPKQEHITTQEHIITVKERVEDEKQQPRTFDIPEKELERYIKRGEFLYTITVYLKRDLTEKGKTPLDLINSIVSTGYLIESRLDIDMINNLSDCLENEIAFVFAFSTILEIDYLPDALGIPKERIIPVDIEVEQKAPLLIPSVVEVDIEVEQKEIQQQKIQPEPELKITNTIQTEDKIKVGVNFLNDLVNLAGEMVLSRNQLNQITMPLIKDTPGLNAAIQHISRITTEMQEKIMQMRMQPVSMIFGKFQRIVRDLAKKLNKEITLLTYGEDVELDKSIIESLSDPLTHLIRNSVDHGIEYPDYREESGKPRQGTIQLKAYHQAGHVYIDIIDDGSGINCRALGEKAVEKELVTKEQMNEMSEKELMMLIFKPGFSTAKQVSAVSGRGVGMDVVMTNIKQLGGSVDVESTLYEGTTISLVLPLTLAIVSGLVIRTNEQCFILPEANIDELVRIKPDEIPSRIEFVQNSCVLRLREMLLPLISLGDVLGLNHDSLKIKLNKASQSKIKKQVLTKYNIQDSSQDNIQNSSQDNNDAASITNEPMRVLVIKYGNSLFGLQVDVVENIEEIVVKPLPRYLKNQKCFSGASIMGNGSVALILDAAGIFEKAKLSRIDLERYRKKIQADKRKKGGSRDDGNNAEDLQTLLIFNNNTPERFALPLELISRIERVNASAIEKIKDQHYLQYQGEKLRLIFLEDYLPITSPDRKVDDTIGVIVPKQMKHPMGIIIHNVEGTVNTAVNIDTKSIIAPGLFGSAILEKKITLLPDMYRLFELAAPEWHLIKNSLRNNSDLNKILIVEDTPFFRMIEKDYLTSAGYGVIEAENGKQALDILYTQKVDAVILDIVMPEMDGWQTIRAIRSDTRLKDLPVMAVTSLADDIDSEKGLKAGFTEWEAKLNKDRLLEKLAKMLNHNEEETA